MQVAQILAALLARLSRQWIGAEGLQGRPCEYSRQCSACRMRGLDCAVGPSQGRWRKPDGGEIPKLPRRRSGARCQRTRGGAARRTRVCCIRGICLARPFFALLGLPCSVCWRRVAVLLSRHGHGLRTSVTTQTSNANYISCASARPTAEWPRQRNYEMSTATAPGGQVGGGGRPGPEAEDTIAKTESDVEPRYQKDTHALERNLPKW